MAYYKFSHFCGQLSLTKKSLCYIIGITIRTRGDEMFIEIDFNSDEAIYVQLRNQIILGIATEQLKEGESLPSVRALAEDIGINMHTVNKAYATLKQDGFLKVDRRRGAVIAIDIDKLRSMSNMREYMKPIVARGMVKGISKEEAMQIVSDLYDELS